MKLNWRRVLVTAIIAGSIGSGCAIIIASDDHDDWDDDECWRCHDEVVIIVPKQEQTDSLTQVLQ